jgi:hypothetical protein
MQKIAGYCHGLCQSAEVKVSEMHNVSVSLRFLEQIVRGELMVIPRPGPAPKE